jgi:hypothetical protein
MTRYPVSIQRLRTDRPQLVAYWLPTAPLQTHRYNPIKKSVWSRSMATASFAIGSNRENKLRGGLRQPCVPVSLLQHLAGARRSDRQRGQDPSKGNARFAQGRRRGGGGEAGWQTLRGCAAARLRGCAAARLRGCAAARRLRGGCAAARRTGGQAGRRAAHCEKKDDRAA